MKYVLYGAAAMALITACGQSSGVTAKASSEDVAAALQDMALNESDVGTISFSGSSVKGGTASFSDLAIVIDEDDNLVLKADALKVDGLNVTDLGASFTAMTFENISLTDEDGEAEMSLGSFTVDQPSPALAAWIASFMETGEPGAFPELGDLSFKGISFESFKLSARDESGDGAIAFDLPSFSLTAFEAGALERFSLDGLTFSLDEPSQNISARGSLDQFEITGWKKAQTDVLMAAFAAAASGASEPYSGLEELFNSNPLDPGYETSALKGISLDFGGLSLASESISSEVTYNRAGEPTAVETKPYKITMTADPSGQYGAQAGPILSLLGLDNGVEVTGASKYSIDVASDSVSADAKDNYISFTDLMSFSFGGDVDGVSAYNQAMIEGAGRSNRNAQGEQEFALAALSNLRLSGFELGLDDNGLIDKGLTLAGAMTGQDPAALKTQVTQQLAFLPLAAGQAGVDATIASELVTALTSFIETPGKLTVKLDPSEPVSVSTFADPSQATKDRLGFSATTE